MATADSVKAKIQGLIDQSNATTGNTDADLTTAVISLIAGFGAGGGGGIGAIKFVDEDITVEESTSTAVTYTIDGAQIPTLAENPNKWSTYSGNEVFLCFITPKEITGEYTGTSKVTTSTMLTLYGHTNYGGTIVYVGGYSGGAGGDIQASYSGFVGAGINSPSSVKDGVVTAAVYVKVQTNPYSGYVVQAGTYNVQFWMLTDFNWGV